MQLKTSDLIYISCTRGVMPYLHYGIYMGDGTVVHLATHGSDGLMVVQRVAIEQFCNGKDVCIEFVPDSLPCEDVIERAMARVGEQGYHLLAGNCEHFARELKTGSRKSTQVDVAVRSIVRSAVSGTASTVAPGAIAGSLRAITGSRALLSVGALVPTAMSETARCATYAVARRWNFTHELAESSSRRVAYMASALGGLVLGGPVGAASALAVTVVSDYVTDAIQQSMTN